MKKLIVVPFYLLFILSLYAQDIKQGMKIPSTYDRSSITVVFLNFPNENHSRDILRKISILAYGDKFYNNNVSYLTIEAPYSHSELTANRAGLIKQTLEDKKIANEIISKWYSVKSDGSMSLDLIHSRGMFNATDAAVLLAKTTKRGNAQLEDYGNRLINKSYIIVLDYQNILTMSEARQRDKRGWQANVSAYLYKIDYNQDVQKSVYDAWIYTDDSQDVKEGKKSVFSKLVIPIVYVTQTNLLINASQNFERSTVERMLFPDKSQEELLNDLVQKGYDENIYSMERLVEDFKVKTTISQVKPIRAKIGKKEGVNTDNRFFAYEYVLNEKNNKTKQVYRGIIRSTSKIADNRQVATGNMDKTIFYQTAGKRLEVGYLLQQRNDMGLEISLGADYGDATGIYGRIDYRLGRYIGIRSLFLFVDYWGGENIDGYAVFRYGGGIAKGIQLSRNIELRPYIGYGKEGDEYNEISYYKGGMNLSMNLIHNFQIYVGGGYYLFEGYDSMHGALALTGGIKFSL